jgi:uncharacterized protein YprB with RNaseH-like and TPR domain
MSLQNTFFIDIETAPIKAEIFSELRSLFQKRFEHQYYGEVVYADWGEFYNKNAGLYAEFGKIVCISIGKVQGTKLYIKTICNEDEIALLNAFTQTIEKAVVLCAHNGKDFDFPFLFRRYLINGITCPAILNRTNKKTWDPGLDDTMEIWSGSQWKYRCSLDLLANVFGLPSPKQGITGADVAGLFYSDDPDKLKKIGEYCSRDLVTLVDVYAKLKQIPTYSEIEFVA